MGVFLGMTEGARDDRDTESGVLGGGVRSNSLGGELNCFTSTEGS